MYALNPVYLFFSGWYGSVMRDLNTSAQLTKTLSLSLSLFLSMQITTGK